MRIRFDRGTLVIDRAPTGIDPVKFLGATWDSDLAAWRAPAERLSELRGRLSAKGVPYSDEIRAAELEPSWRLPELRWYQRAAIDAWHDAADRGVIVLPTGAGKTIAAIAAVAELGVAALCLVPTRVLLDQWARSLAECWPHPIGRLGDGEHRVTPITVATYASAVVWAPRLGDRFGLVIVDEAHHVGAWCPHEVLEMFVAPARLGLTATPPTGVAAAALERHLGPVVYTIGIEDLRGDALSDFTLQTIHIALSRQERERYLTLRGQFAAHYYAARRFDPAMTWSEFVRSAQRSQRGRDALAAWRGSRALLAYPAGKRAAVRELLARHASDRVLVFTANNATAYAIARELLISPVTCDIRRAERAAMIERFRSGETPVLVSSQVLDEGFDVPDADVAIVVGGTSSRRRYVQRIGRVLRPRPGKRAVVYELAVEATTEVAQVMQRRGALSSSGAWS